MPGVMKRVKKILQIFLLAGQASIWSNFNALHHVFLVALCGLIIGIGNTDTLMAATKNTLNKKNIEVDGRTRNYLISLPDKPPSPSGFPVMYVLHGGGGTMRASARMSRFHNTGAAQNWIVIYPQGIRNKLKSNWNDGRVHTQAGKESYAKIDDVKFIVSILTRLRENHPIDLQRIYATGVSNGAYLSQRLASEHADIFAAIAPVIGSMAESVAQHFSPSQPVSVLMLNGTDDPLVPYGGGMSKFGKTNLGLALPVDKLVHMWVSHNKNDPQPVIDMLPDSRPDDGCTIERHKYSSGPSSAEVILLKAHGGGHTSPGDRQYAPKKLIGATCYDIHASDVIVDFFAKHPKSYAK